MTFAWELVITKAKIFNRNFKKLILVFALSAEDATVDIVSFHRLVLASLLTAIVKVD